MVGTRRTRRRSSGKRQEEDVDDVGQSESEAESVGEAAAAAERESDGKGKRSATSTGKKSTGKGKKSTRVSKKQMDAAKTALQSALGALLAEKQASGDMHGGRKRSRSDFDSDESGDEDDELDVDIDDEEDDEDETEGEDRYELSLNPGPLPKGAGLPASSFLGSLVARRTQDGLSKSERFDRLPEHQGSVSASLRQLEQLQKLEDHNAMRKSVVHNLEKRRMAPDLKKRRVKQNKRDTAGRGWFDMEAPRMTAELKQDLRVLKLRGYIDPKRHYKANDSSRLPKYFQVGTWVEGKADFYSSRVPKKQRKQRLVDELLADTQFRSYAKKKLHQRQAQSKASTFYGRGSKDGRSRKGQSRQRGRR